MGLLQKNEAPKPATLVQARRRVHGQHMNEEPMAYIITALSSVGIICRTLDISSYDPIAFGNLVAKAETSIGELNIVYDRGFFVEAQQADTAILDRITEALGQHKRTADA